MEQTKVIYELIDWIIPAFGNKHFLPYGTIQITDGKIVKKCKIKGCEEGKTENYQYITFLRKRYKVINKGGFFHPVIKLELLNK